MVEELNKILDELNKEFDVYCKEFEKKVKDLRQHGYECTCNKEKQIRSFLEGKVIAVPIVFINNKFESQYFMQRNYDIEDEYLVEFFKCIMPDVLMCLFDKEMSVQFVKRRINELKQEKFNKELTIKMKELHDNIFYSVCDDLNIDQKTALHFIRDKIEYVMINDYCVKHVSVQQLKKFLARYAEALK